MPFRFVLLGAGFFARKWLETLTGREDCEVVGIASRTSARAEELKRDFDLAGVAVYPGWEMAAAKGVADGVLITLPQEAIPGGELGHALTEFLGAIREKRQPETHVAEHVRSLALPLAVVESSRRRAPVEVAELLGFLES